MSESQQLLAGKIAEIEEWRARGGMPFFWWRMAWRRRERKMLFFSVFCRLHNGGMDSRAQSFFSCLKNVPFEFFKKKQEAQFFSPAYLFVGKQTLPLFYIDIVVSWGESGSIVQLKKIPNNFHTKRKKEGGRERGFGRKIKILACQPKSPFVPKKKIFEREKRLTKCCALCLSFVVGMERETKILGTVSVLYWEGDLLIDPPKKPLFPKNEDLRRFFHFYFDAPSQGEEPPEIEVINEVQPFPPPPPPPFLKLPANIFLSSGQSKPKNVFG